MISDRGSYCINLLDLSQNNCWWFLRLAKVKSVLKGVVQQRVLNSENKQCGSRKNIAIAARSSV